MDLVGALSSTVFCYRWNAVQFSWENMFLADWFYGILALLGLWQKEAEEAKEAKVLLLGPEDPRGNGMKRVVLQTLHDQRLVQQQPTQYPISEELSIGGIKFKIYDFGELGRGSGHGMAPVPHQMARRLWRDYFAHGDAMVYLLDVHDEWSHYQTRWELDALLSDASLANVPLLILAVNTTQGHLHHLGLPQFTTGDGNVNLSDPYVRPVGVFRCPYLNVMEYYNRGFRWLSQYIN